MERNINTTLIVFIEQPVVAAQTSQCEYVNTKTFAICYFNTAKKRGCPKGKSYYPHRQGYFAAKTEV